MLITKIEYDEKNKVLNKKVELECNICKNIYILSYQGFLEKFQKYNETPCAKCIRSLPRPKNNFISKNPKHNVVCENCGKEYILNHTNYNHNIEKYNNIVCRSCRITLRQKGKTLVEQWGKEKAEKAKEKISKKLMGKPAQRINRKWTKEQIENLKKVRPNTGTYEERYGEERSKEIKYKISKNSTKPNLGKPAPQGSGNGWSGWYNGLFFRSLLELSFIINYLEKNNFKFESGELAKYKIEYINYEGRKANYFSDFVIENKTMVEVKPFNLLKSVSVNLKKEAAINWCKTNGLEYKIFSEKDFKKLELDEIRNLLENNKIKFTDRYQNKYNEIYGAI